MTQWQESFQEWGTAWAAVRGLDAEAGESALTATGDDGGVERFAVWPGADAEGLMTALTAGAPGTLLWLATDLASEAEHDGAAEAAEKHHLVAAEQLILLSAVTDDLEFASELPEEAVVAEAPLERFDAVEIAVFDRPVASGRIRITGELGVLGHIHAEAQDSDAVTVLEQGVVTALAEEAFFHGAETLYLVAGREQAERFAASGWQRIARISGFRKA